MEEIRIKGNKGTICFDTNNKSDKLRVTTIDDKGYADSHYVFNQTITQYPHKIRNSL